MKRIHGCLYLGHDCFRWILMVTVKNKVTKMYIYRLIEFASTQPAGVLRFVYRYYAVFNSPVLENIVKTYLKLCFIDLYLYICRLWYNYLPRDVFITVPHIVVNLLCWCQKHIIVLSESCNVSHSCTCTCFSVIFHLCTNLAALHWFTDRFDHQ